MKLAFYKGTRPGLQGVFSVLARFCTRSKYSHVELVFSNGDSASSSFIDGGVRILSGDKQIEFNPQKWDFISINPEKYGTSEKIIREWFENNSKTPYDLRAMLACALPIVGNSEEKYMCSEAIAHVLGLTDAWRYSPPVLYSAIKGVNFGTPFQ